MKNCSKWERQKNKCQDLFYALNEKKMWRKRKKELSFCLISFVYILFMVEFDLFSLFWRFLLWEREISRSIHSIFQFFQMYPLVRSPGTLLSVFSIQKSSQWQSLSIHSFGCFPLFFIGKLINQSTSHSQKKVFYFRRKQICELLLFFFS